VKRCASCGREVSETSTVCDLCERWAADQVHSTPAGSSSQVRSSAGEPMSSPAAAMQTSAAPARASQPHAVAAPAQQRAGGSRLSRRELMIIVGAVVLGSAITFALGGSHSDAIATAPAANRAPAKPAAAAAPAPRSDSDMEHRASGILDRKSASQRRVRVTRREHRCDLAQLRASYPDRPVHGQAHGGIRLYRDRR
jgi:hypothetical protein